MSMKKIACLLMLLLPLGCQPPANKGGSAPGTPSTDTKGGQGDKPKADGNATSAIDSDDTLTELVMNVEGMSCPLGCPPAVQTALKSVDGVQDVVVDFEHKTATVKCNAEKFNQQQAVEALAQAGFQGAVKN